MNRAVAGVLVLLLVLVARPLAQIARAQAPQAPEANRIGVGRLMGGVLTGAFRPMLLTYLWVRADILNGQGRFDELHQLYRTIRSLYPGNERAREYIGWNLAFNLKNEALTDELAWKWTEEGLDMLFDTDGGRHTLAYWCLAQCGQNAVHPFAPMRYAGPDWKREKWWRARTMAWSERRFGERLDRFALGVKVLAERQGFYDKMRRALLYERLVLDDMARAGRSDHTEAAVRALRTFAQRVVDNPNLARAFLGSVGLLQALDARDLSRMRAGPHTYRTAAALWGIGAHHRDAAFLRAARTLLREMENGPELYAEELRLIDGWLAHLEDPSTPRPPLPFD